MMLTLSASTMTCSESAPDVPPHATVADAHGQHQRDEADGRLAVLVADMADGQELALRQLHLFTAPRLRSTLFRLLRRADLVDELLMDVYWRAWRQAARYDPQRGQVMAWLTTMARSRALDELRRQACRPLGQLFDEDLDRLPCPSPLADPQQAVSHRQLLNLVAIALQRLSAVARQLVSMALFGGMSHEQIARATRLPLGTVKSHIRRGLQRIKALLVGPLDLADLPLAA